MSEWYESRRGLLDTVWQRLAHGVADGRAPARRPVFATIGRDGGPEARIVVLRGADRDAATLEFHTDAATPKVADLAADPRAAVHIWEARLKLQMRFRGRVEVQTGDPRAWAAVPAGSRGNYGANPVPGTPIPASGAFTRVPDPDRFAVLRLMLDRIEALHLGEPHHRRAVFRRADGWAGQWIAP